MPESLNRFAVTVEEYDPFHAYFDVAFTAQINYLIGEMFFYK